MNLKLFSLYFQIFRKSKIIFSFNSKHDEGDKIYNLYPGYFCRSVRNSIHVNLCLSLLLAHTLTLTAIQVSTCFIRSARVNSGQYVFFKVSTSFLRVSTCFLQVSTYFFRLARVFFRLARVSSGQHVFSSGQHVFSSGQHVFFSGQHVFFSGQHVFSSGQHVFYSGHLMFLRLVRVFFTLTRVFIFRTG